MPATVFRPIGWGRSDLLLMSFSPFLSPLEATTGGSCNSVLMAISTSAWVTAVHPVTHQILPRILPSCLEKCIRIHVDAGSPYGLPSDNPFVGNPYSRDENWASGLRNPWRFSFDRLTGDLFIADVGQRSWQEVNFQPAGSIGGENYASRLMEGNHCYEPEANCNDGSLVLPTLEYGHSLGDCSITGGYRYRGSKNPRLTDCIFTVILLGPNLGCC